MTFQSNSSIAMALAGKTASVDIPQPRAGLPGKSQSRPGHPAMLPTPPNSISPTLPPQAFKNNRPTLSPGSPLSPVPQLDSDLDLHDAVEREHANTQRARLDSVGDITPAMLAKCHLPDILLQQGPLAIRHIMGYLTTSVPGFSRIPPAKARRLVVTALESRGSEDDDVVFEKIGWGRWDARHPNEGPRDRAMNFHASSPSSVAESFPRGVQIQGQSWAARRDSRDPYGASMGRNSIAFSYADAEDYGARDEYEDLDMLEHEADKMSLDGDREYASSSEAEDLQEDQWDEGDVTDEEDWAQIGADALRARSMNGGGGFVRSSNVAAVAKAPPAGFFGHNGPTASTIAKSTPRTFDNQERAAVEALLRLGSM